MQTQLAFFASIAFSLTAWGMVAARYIWPELRLRQRTEALRPLLIFPSFRFIGLAFLVPGVVSPVIAGERDDTHARASATFLLPNLFTVSVDFRNDMNQNHSRPAQH